MRVSFRLDQVLQRIGLPDRGRITKLSEGTEIERHIVSAMLNNSVTRISIDHLGAICRYLIEEHRVDPRGIFDQLFALEPSKFLSTLREQQKLTTCFGVRQGQTDRSQQWVTSADSYLHGRILERLFRHDIQETQKTQETRKEASNKHSAVPEFHQQLVRACSLEDTKDETRLNQVKEEADKTDRTIHAEPAGLTTLILGSVKSNPICELVTARTFGAVCWASHGRPSGNLSNSNPSQLGLPDSPRDRAVPFFFRYRNDEEHNLVDVPVPSCCAGLRLAARDVTCGENSTSPGIYFEKEGGEWTCYPSTSEQDAAVVLYDYRPSSGTIDCVMGGFSSAATLGLAVALEQIAEQLWPPNYDTTGRCVGVFIIQFEFGRQAGEGQGQLALAHLPVLKSVEVVRIAKEVLARRLESKPSDR